MSNNAAPYDVQASSPYVQMVIPGQERVIAWADCPRCNGKGYKSFDDWREMATEDGVTVKANFGHIVLCICNGGKVLSHWYTRGVGLVPLISRKGS